MAESLANEEMAPETLEALRGSIAKWERVVAGEITGHARSDCALCGLFYERTCDGCPVSKASGIAYCKRTPYRAYMDNLDKRGPQADETKAAAQVELDFLKSLLPRDIPALKEAQP